MVVLSLFVFVSPATVNAGFFSSIFRFLVGEGEVEPDVERSWSAVSMPLVGSQPISLGASDGTGGPENFEIEEASGSTPSVQDSVLVAPKNPAGTMPLSRQDEILVYTVQPGDVPGKIAEKFGISLNTLLWANNIRNPDLIKAGDELIILPVSGIRYEVKKGDTLESIAKEFKGDPIEILGFNGLAIGEKLEIGMTLIIPDGELTPLPSVAASVQPSRSFSGLPEYGGYYMRPIFGGRKSRGIHGFNGVDLANSCGLPVLASAEGTVIIVRSSGWNGGYGKYMVMSHPNGTQTLYAHLSSVLARVGQRVAQGSQIAVIGSTGNSTGCHVHFEIRGARNPF